MRIIKSVAALCSAALLLAACDGDGAETKSAAEQPIVSLTNEQASAKFNNVDPIEYLVPEAGYYVASPDGMMNCSLRFGYNLYDGHISCDKKGDPRNFTSDMPACPHWETDSPSRFPLGFTAPCQEFIQGWSLRTQHGPFTPKTLEPGNRISLSPGVGCLTDEEGVFSCVTNGGGFSYHDYQVHSLTQEETRATIAAMLQPAANAPTNDQCGVDLTPARFVRDLNMTVDQVFLLNIPSTWRVWRGNFDPCTELSWVQFVGYSTGEGHVPTSDYSTTTIFYSKGVPVYVVPGTSQHVEETDSTHYRVSWFDDDKCSRQELLPGVASLAFENGEFKATLESWDPSDTDPEHEGQIPPVQYPACSHPVTDPEGDAVPSYDEATADTGVAAMHYVQFRIPSYDGERQKVFAPTAPVRNDLELTRRFYNMPGYAFRTADNKVGCYLLQHRNDQHMPFVLCTTIEGAKLADSPDATPFEASPWIINQDPILASKPATQLMWSPSLYLLPRVTSVRESSAREFADNPISTQLSVGDSFSAFDLIQCTQETESLLSCSYGATTLQIDGTKVSVSLEP